MTLSRCLLPVMLMLLSGSVGNPLLAEDVAVLVTGSRVTGKVISRDAENVSMEVKIGTRTFTRRYPVSRIKTLTIDGSEVNLNGTGTTSSPAGGNSSGGSSSDNTAARSSREILDEIDRVGRTPPDWFDQTPLSYPNTLDLSWPEKPPGGWDSSKNVGQFIWDRINTNESKWREGVRFMHHILSITKDAGVRERAMLALGAMYHNLHQDYARAAFWYHMVGVDKSPDARPQAGMFLANCYWHLGSKQMALETLAKMKRKPYGVIKLLGDLGEPDAAVNLAEQFARTGDGNISFLYAGDACRVAGRLEDAEKYYRRSITAIKPADADKHHAVRNKSRAEASIAAIRFYTLDPAKVKNGTYTAGSIGYEAEVKIEVVVKDGRIESVRVTQHREKQFYSSINDTPRRIVERQSVNGIDTTSGATITSEAIINATAKALASGL